MIIRILWIEDDADIIYGVMEPLIRKGHIIDTVKSMKEYLEKTDELLKGYDLIVLDILLPEGFGEKPKVRYTGLYILKHIRKERKMDLPVIILSVVRDKRLLDELKNLNVEKILDKPILPSKLADEIEGVFRNKR